MRTRPEKPSRARRRQLEREYGITSGRQWVRLRRRLQRAVRAARAAAPKVEVNRVGIVPRVRAK